MPVVSAASHRWRDYFMESGANLERFWASRYTEDRRVLLILGKGFDPRMCLAFDFLLRVGAKGKTSVIAIELDEGTASPSTAYQSRVDDNWDRMNELAAGRASVSTKTLQMWSADRRRIGSRNAAKLFASPGDFAEYTDVILDISALPRAIFFPIIAKILHMLDHGGHGDSMPNFHVMVAEDSALDRRIVDEGIDESASYIHPFGGTLEMEATADNPKVWIPVMGERQRIQLARIYDLVLPDEIVPVLPSPASNPRRADNLLLEYRELLFDRLRVEPGNFIFASEQNSFEVYRQIRDAVLHYQDALRPLGGCKAVLSALSTKLLSIGTLLSAYELKEAGIDVGIAHVECQGYTLEGEEEMASAPSEALLFGLWLWGECYEP